MTVRVAIGRETIAAIIGHAHEDRPDECCGILIGRGETIVESARVPNVSSAKATRYELDPATYIRVRRDARARGLDVVGFYHSHPQSRAEPSATDLSEALYPDHFYLIVGWPDGLTPETRVFRLAEEQFEEAALEIDER